MRKFLAALFLSVGMVTATMAVEPPKKPAEPQKQEEALKTGLQQYSAVCMTAGEFAAMIKKEGFRLALAGNHPYSGNYISVWTDPDGKTATITEIPEDGKTVCLLTILTEYGVDLMAFKAKRPEGKEEETND